MTSTSQRPRVLVVDDEAPMRELLRLGLTRCHVEEADGTSAARALLDREPIDVVVTDLALAGERGETLCREVVANHPDVPVIVLTGFGSFESAVDALRAGASDFVTKPVDLEVLQLAIDRALVTRSLRAEVARLRSDVLRSHGLPGLVGASPSIRRVAEIVTRVADSDASVLVTGESGTGKEIVARALHGEGRRRSGPFVALNCAALPEHLLESELFGHVRGAFTDARAARTGLLVQASGGTLFLDELGEMPPSLQAKLLRAISERRVRPLGADAEVPFDVRIVAATHVDLEAAIQAGRFREDLYFRLAVVTIELPPLRARGDDVLLIAQHLLEQLGARAGKRMRGFHPRAAAHLREYDWPGNVRELANCIERAVAFARYEDVVEDDLPDRIRAAAARTPAAAAPWDEVVPLEEVERRYALWAFDRLGRNKSLTAHALGIDRKTLARKLGA